MGWLDLTSVRFHFEDASASALARTSDPMTQLDLSLIQLYQNLPHSPLKVSHPVEEICGFSAFFLECLETLFFELILT